MLFKYLKWECQTQEIQLSLLPAPYQSRSDTIWTVMAVIESEAYDESIVLAVRQN
jgi:hypothetical protein